MDLPITVLLAGGPACTPWFTRISPLDRRVAINKTGKHSAAELHIHFISSAGNLSLIWNLINETVDENLFNWHEFSNVASIFLIEVT